MPRPLLAVVGWVVATAAAVAVAHAGVSAVAGRVVDPLPPAVGMATTPDPTPTPPPPSPSTSSTPSATGTDGPTGATASPTPTAGLPSSSPTSSAPTSAPSPSTPAPPAEPTATREVRSYALVGGTATLQFEPGRVTVLAAEPAQGFSLEVEGDGTGEVRVEFESDTHRSRLRGAWDDGPEDRIDEDARSDDEEDEPDEDD